MSDRAQDVIDDVMHNYYAHGETVMAALNEAGWAVVRMEDAQDARLGAALRWLAAGKPWRLRIDRHGWSWYREGWSDHCTSLDSLGDLLASLTAAMDEDGA